MADELKPCPFCGAPAELKRRKTVMVSCTGCSASTFQLLNDNASAPRQWNTRHQPNGGDGADLSPGGTVATDRDDELSGMWEQADFMGGATDAGADVARDVARWRELCRRLYVELFYCDQQMTGVRQKWVTGKSVSDVLRDAKEALAAMSDHNKGSGNG